MRDDVSRRSFLKLAAGAGLVAVLPAGMARAAITPAEPLPDLSAYRVVDIRDRYFRAADMPALEAEIAGCYLLTMNGLSFGPGCCLTIRGGSLGTRILGSDLRFVRGDGDGPALLFSGDVVGEFWGLTMVGGAGPFIRVVGEPA